MAELRDSNHKRFRRGVYTDGSDLSNISDSNYYLIFSEKGVWKAIGVEGKVLELAVPQGMPDTERVPEGKLSIYRLTPVSAKRLDGLIERYNKEAIKVGEMAGLLKFAKFVDIVAGSKR